MCLEWEALDFTYHAIATTVSRLSSSSLHDHLVREQCLSRARRALTSMNALQNHVCHHERICFDFLFWYELIFFLFIIMIVQGGSNPNSQQDSTPLSTHTLLHSLL